MFGCLANLIFMIDMDLFKFNKVVLTGALLFLELSSIRKEMNNERHNLKKL